MPSFFLRPGCAGMAMWAVAAVTQAQTLPWSVDRQQTRVFWEVRHFGTSTSRGRFDDLDVQLRLDRDAGRGELSVTVGTASVDTGVPALDGVLRGDAFFASTAWPQAWFVSRQFRFDGPRVTEVVGELTLRGTSLPFTLRASHFGCHVRPEDGREVCGGDFEGELRRGDFGITQGLPLVGDRVRVVVQVEAVTP